MLVYLYTSACSESDYQDAALICLLWYLFGRASDLLMIRKRNISIDAAGVFFLRLVRVKTSEEQGLSLFPDADFATCPLLAVGLALVVQAAPSPALIDNLPDQAQLTSVTLSPDVPLVELLNARPETTGLLAPAAAPRPSTDADMAPSPSARRGEGLFAESQPRSCATPRVSDERESSLIDLTTSSDVDVDQRLTSRTNLPRQPSPPGDTTSDAEHESDSARRVTLESLECLLRFQARQREQELDELTRFVAFSLTRPAAPSDRAQRDALLSATTIHELGDALGRQFAGPDSAAVIADLRTELQVVQQINTSLTRRLDTQSAELADLQGQLKVMTLERDRLLDLSKQSTAFSASLRQSVAELEARVASARAVSDAETATAFRHADDCKRQVLDRDQEIATLRASIVDRDRAYATLQGVAT
ncbi:unnamed protein product [Phytophthora fragariaefolia]|uniref:Unnamed protein product n=1 Tax=Phytophthora fragariaefolia TaxID=1490495 RepID=A0A9W7CIZ1_9STRA|nr:unnamed protein product [Phytophthora fragariaefolia]